MDNFGIFIRSIGEKSESLCYDSCLRFIPKEKIHLLKNYYPAYEVYKKMFEESIRLGYDYFLGVDADIVLVPDWYEKVLACKKEIDSVDNWFKFSFSVQDRFLGIINRGNHFYNGKWSQEALDVLETKTKYSHKPESDIRHFIPGGQKYFKQEVIGFHSYEQFWEDLAYRFWLQAKRDPSLELKYNFLKNCNTEDVEESVAYIAWKEGYPNMWEKFRKRLANKFGIDWGFKSDARLKDFVSEIVKNKAGSIELANHKAISLDNFYSKYKI